ncbi:MAG: hypothetical protein Q4G59_11475 [Planctomycetia bacterium]|nr:hypothetical protein [Planctomycetia bacterium]
MKRRDFLASAVTASSSLLVMPGFTRFVHAAENAKFPPMRQLTHGPLFHWGAYYDQIHFDKTNRIVIANEVDFEGRSPSPTDKINVGLVDTEDNNKWTKIGSSTSWNWQQGCMLQWIPGSSDEVIWNEQDGDKYISKTYNWKTGKRRTLPGAVYALSPNGKFAVRPDFRRLGHTRPGYGYNCIPDPNADVLIPDDAGIWKIDLETGKEKLLFTFADVAKIPIPGGFPQGVKHWFNHLIVSPDSTRFLFLHRWQREAGKPLWYTRLLTAKADGTDVRVVNNPPMTSHLVWRDPSHIIAYANHPSHGNQVYLFNIYTGQAEVCGKEADFGGDTHVSFVPGTNNRWILNDTYPRGKERLQSLFLLDLEKDRKIDLASIYSPPSYKGEWRIDLHPRSSRDGKKVLIDAPEPKVGGRQIFMVDIDGLIDG